MAAAFQRSNAGPNLSWARGSGSTSPMNRSSASVLSVIPAARPPQDDIPAGMLTEAFDWGGTLQEVGTRAVEYVERFKIESALKSSQWNKTRAAELLGVSYKTLLNKIRLLGLES